MIAQHPGSFHRTFAPFGRPDLIAPVCRRSAAAGSNAKWFFDGLSNRCRKTVDATALTDVLDGEAATKSPQPPPAGRENFDGTHTSIVRLPYGIAISNYLADRIANMDGTSSPLQQRGAIRPRLRRCLNQYRRLKPFRRPDGGASPGPNGGGA